MTMSPRLIVGYCGLLMSVSAISVDSTLPVFPAMVDDLAAPYERVQWSVTVFILSLGIGHLLWGSASDRFGRRPVLASGLSIFVVGNALAVVAPTIETLLAGRILQGVGGAAAVVSSRAIIRDLFSGRDLARNLAMATAVFAFGPIVAPLAGSAIAAVSGWRTVFGATAGFGVLLLAALFFLPETVPVRTVDAMRPAVMVRRTGQLFAHPQSRYFLLLSGLVMSAIILILSGAPRVYEASFGIAGTSFAVYFAIHGIGIIIGQMVNRRLIGSIGTERTMLRAGFVLVLASGLMLALTLGGLMTGWLVTALLVLFASSYLIVYSNAASLVLDPHGDIAGFAASFYGFLSQVVSALIVSGLVVIGGDSLTAWATMLLAICLGTLVAVGLWQRSAAERHTGREA